MNISNSQENDEFLIALDLQHFLDRNICTFQKKELSSYESDVQVESLVEFGRPVARLALGGHFAFLVGEMRSDEVDLDERLEHARRLPAEVVCGQN